MLIVWQDIDKVGDLDFTLCLVELAALRVSSIWIVFLKHNRVLNGILEGVSEETSVAAPRIVITVDDLLSRQVLHRS